MNVTFTNPQGRTNQITIKREDLAKLQALEGYTITQFEGVDPFTDDTPAISRTLNIIKAGTNSTCVSCEG